MIWLGAVRMSVYERAAGLAQANWNFTITLHVVVEKQAVVHGDKAEAGVVALFRNVARGQTGVGQRSRGTAAVLGPLERLNVPRQTHTFTLKTEHDTQK